MAQAGFTASHAEAVRHLPEAKDDARPEMHTFNEEVPSPLYLAAQTGNTAIGKLLLACGANHEFELGSSKYRPLHQAVQNGHLEFVGLLLSSKVYVDPREEDGWTPLMLAAQENHLTIVDLLILNSANVNARGDDDVTALWIASQHGHIDIVKRLHQAEAKACQNAHLEVVKYLVENMGEDVNVKTENHATPMLLAAQGNEDVRVELLEYLHEKGARAVIT
ncbi:unnamed protein product [Parascedosporium putredinis]|uniref:Uncharacterized protein n=1 Tax=Parascedosporium putredinis TaxID=1442378 RepID=A0A9P1M8H6_9PEZI|nr:unnamed protein product [Parascedosporium putredinis]CAI7992672.1 unnamed protein product [Parascedosporium putredinis]